MSTRASRLRRVGAWIMMLDRRDRAVRPRDKASRALFQALFALSTLTAIFGPGEGSRWVPAMFAVVFVLVGRLTLRQNIRLALRGEVGCTAETTSGDVHQMLFRRECGYVVCGMVGRA